MSLVTHAFMLLKLYWCRRRGSNPYTQRARDFLTTIVFTTSNFKPILMQAIKLAQLRITVCGLDCVLIILLLGGN